jgi:hypothetical protein
VDVQLLMLRGGSQFQVLWPIVSAVTVHVVHFFAALKRSTDQLLHDDAVLKRPVVPALLRLDLDIAVGAQSFRSDWPRAPQPAYGGVAVDAPSLVVERAPSQRLMGLTT